MAPSYIEPLSKYMALRPRAPASLKAPPNVWDLFSMAGGADPKGGSAKTYLGDLRGQRYWPAYCNGDSMLTEWLKSGSAFVPPADWPCQLDFPERVTPFRFARDVVGALYYTRQRGILHDAPEWEVLHAWAHGWPVHGRQYRKMRKAATWLMQQPNFLAWAYDLDFSLVPMPFDHNIGYFRRLQARSRFDGDPLGVGSATLRWSVPKGLLAPEEMLSRVSPKPGGFVGPSTKLPKIMGLEIDRAGLPLERT